MASRKAQFHFKKESNRMGTARMFQMRRQPCRELVPQLKRYSNKVVCVLLVRLRV